MIAVSGNFYMLIFFFFFKEWPLDSYISSLISTLNVLPSLKSTCIKKSYLGLMLFG